MSTHVSRHEYSHEQAGNGRPKNRPRPPPRKLGAGPGRMTGPWTLNALSLSCSPSPCAGRPALQFAAGTAARCDSFRYTHTLRRAPRAVQACYCAVRASDAQPEGLGAQRVKRPAPRLSLGFPAACAARLLSRFLSGLPVVLAGIRLSSGQTAHYFRDGLGRKRRARVSRFSETGLRLFRDWFLYWVGVSGFGGSSGFGAGL